MDSVETESIVANAEGPSMGKHVIFRFQVCVFAGLLSGISVPSFADWNTTAQLDINGAHQCAWEPPSTADFPNYYLTSATASGAPSSFERTVDNIHRIVARFHVVRRSDGSGGLDEKLIDAMMTDINYGYRDTPFVYVRDPQLIYIDNDEYYADFPTFASAFDMLREYQEPGVINWFVTPKIRTQIAGVWIPPASLFRGILIRYDTIGTPSFMRLPVHEMAHIFQVYHPFETVFGTECTSGSNCANAGDLVCDTPASPQLWPGNTTGTGVYYGAPAGPCPGDPPYDPDTSVYMLGSWPAGSILANHFTQGEMDRAVSFLQPGVTFSVSDLVGPHRPDITPDCDGNGKDDVNEIINGETADINRDMEPDVCQVFPDSGDLIVSGMNGDFNNRLRYYDRETGDWRGDLWNGMDFMHQVRQGPDGLLYLPTQTIVTRVDPATGRSVDNFVDGVLEGVGQFVDVLFEQSGNMLVLDNTRSNVRRYNGNTGQSMGIFINTQVGSFSPKYMEYGPDGHIYIVGTGGAGNAVHKFDAENGQYLGEFIAAGSGGLLSGQGLVFHSDGFLYVSNGAANNILRFNADNGEFDREFVTTAGNGGLSNPHSLRFGPDGHLYVASRSTHSVKRYDGETGAFIDDFVTPRSGGSPGTGGLSQPAGLLFIDPEGLIVGPDINAGMSGAWTNLDTLGQGMFLDVIESSGQIFLGWFTYEADQGINGDEQDNTHRWMVAIGPFTGNTAELELLSVSGGTFNGPDEVTETPVGTATLTFRSCTEAVFDYQLDVGISRTMQLNRLLPDALCDERSAENLK